MNHVSKLNATNYRRSCLEVFCEKVALKNFAKFTVPEQNKQNICARVSYLINTSGLELY